MKKNSHDEIDENVNNIINESDHAGLHNYYGINKVPHPIRTIIIAVSIIASIFALFKISQM